MPCPCCSQRPFSDCCESYLTGQQKAPTPEKLMRSRYTAYSLAQIDYIIKTMREEAAENYNIESAHAWASSVKWLGLTVIDTPTPSETHGNVTFFARFSENGIQKYIYEKSDFEKMGDEWFYVNGITPKIERNDPCPCGSGKKFKKCCGFN